MPSPSKANEMPVLQPRKRRKVSVEIVDNDERTFRTPKRAKMSASPASSPTKRMLARSKTESCIDSQTTNATRFDRTPSLPNIASTSSPPQHRTLPTTTRTYAGKSRSFLVAIPASALSVPNGILPDEEDEYTRESYASLRTRWGVDDSEDDPYPEQPMPSPSRSTATSTPSGSPRKGKGKSVQSSQQAMSIPNGMMNPLKSITELRSKGESRRFLDEVGYLFEGMEAAGGIGLRRASALEITTKLCDVEFARKAKAADFLGRAWDVFLEAGAGTLGDKVLDTLLAFFAALVARDPADLVDLAQRACQPSRLSTPEKGKQKQEDPERLPSSLVDTLFSLLVPCSSGDPLALISSNDRHVQDSELKKMGVQKKDRTLFQTIYNTITSKSLLFPPDTLISTSFLIMHALQPLPPSLIATCYVPALLSSLRTILSSFFPPSTSPSSSRPDTTHDIHFENVYYHLRMLDMYFLGQWDTTTSTTSTSGADQNINSNDNEPSNNLAALVMNSARNWLPDVLIALGIYTEIRGGPSASSITEITLRVLVNLTHGDAAWARAVVECQCANALAWVMRVVMGFQLGVVKREPAGEKGFKKEDAEVVEAGAWPGRAELEEEGETQALDRLCLALGLLTNIVQVVEETKDLLREIRIHPSCKLKNQSCILGCTCATPLTFSHNKKKVNSSSLSALDVLVQLYIHQLPSVSLTSVSTPVPSIPIKKEPESSLSPPPQDTLPRPGRDRDRDRDTLDASFLRGHLAVLFGLLMRGNPQNQEYILDALGAVGVHGDDREQRPAEDRFKCGLERLVEQARGFAAFYALISRNRGGRANGEVEAEMVTVRESKVARDVVQFLESLNINLLTEVQGKPSYRF